MKVLIGGGSGFIGRHLTKLLTHKGYEVTLISRTAGAGRITWHDLDRVGLPDGCVAVVNLAGKLLMDPLRRWNADLREEIHSSRVATTQQLATAIAKADTKPRVWLSASAVGIYPTSVTMEYTEDTAIPTATDYLTQLCVDWEATAQLPQDIATRHVTLRIGLVLGRDGGLMKNMYLPFYLGVGGRIGSGKQWFPWIHIDDMTGLLLHAIEHNVSGVMNAVAPHPVTNGDFTHTLASAMWRPAILPVPALVLSTVYGAERARLMLEGQKVIPKRTLQSGYKFIYPDLKSACEDCIKWR